MAGIDRAGRGNQGHVCVRDSDDGDGGDSAQLVQGQAAVVLKRLPRQLTHSLPGTGRQDGADSNGTCQRGVLPCNLLELGSRDRLSPRHDQQLA